MEVSGLDIKKLTLDDIVNAMRINGIKTIEIDTKHTSQRHIEKEYSATITEWYGSVTRINLK